MKLLWKIAISLITILTFIQGYEYAASYWSWKSLSSNEVVAKIAEYDLRYHVTTSSSAPTFACLYVVECDGRGAKLRLIQNVEEWDIEETRKLIWKRRTSQTCGGRVTNIGLEFASENPQATIPSYNKHARWVFFHDRFLQRHSRV